MRVSIDKQDLPEYNTATKHVPVKHTTAAPTQRQMKYIESLINKGINREQANKLIKVLKGEI